MKTELWFGELLLAEKLANLFRSSESFGGMIYVTNRRVIFESHGTIGQIWNIISVVVRLASAPILASGPRRGHGENPRADEPAARATRGTTEIPLENIADVRPRNNLWIISNGMQIETFDGVRYRFVIWDRAQIIDMIQVCKSGAVWETQDNPPQRTDTPSADPSIQPASSVEGTAKKN
jgi:hypothetical protein